MNHKLENLFFDRLSAGLRRTTITKCSQWAEQYRIMGQPIAGPFRFKHHPWCREMHDCDTETVAGMKAAQMGYTEVALNKAFYTIDMLGRSVLYVLPAATPDASDFSTSRFDPALEMSDHINNLFSDVKNIGHKRAGNANLFVRGSRSRSQLKSLPVALAIADELDEMVQGKRSSYS
jgi:Bacteriophage tail assembly protein